MIYSTYTRLDADIVEALGLDSTGTDGNNRFPYTVDTLLDGELLLLNLLAAEAEHYPEDAREPEAARWLESTDRELIERFGERTERISDWSMRYHANLHDLIDEARKDRGATLVKVIKGSRWHDGDVVQTQVPYDDNPCSVVRVNGAWLVVTPEHSVDFDSDMRRSDEEIDAWLTEGVILVKVEQGHLPKEYGPGPKYEPIETECVWCGAALNEKGEADALVHSS